MEHIFLHNKTSARKRKNNNLMYGMNILSLSLYHNQLVHCFSSGPGLHETNPTAAVFHRWMLVSTSSMVFERFYCLMFTASATIPVHITRHHTHGLSNSRKVAVSKCWPNTTAAVVLI